MGVCLLPESENQGVAMMTLSLEVVTFVAIDWKPQSDVFPRNWDDNCPILTAAN